LPQVQLYLADCVTKLPEIASESVDAVITDPPYLTDAPAVPIRGRGVAPRKTESVSVGVPWGYHLDWIDAVGRLKPKHWIVFCNYKMLGSIQSRIEQYAKTSCLFVWRKSNAPNMTRHVPRFDCEFILWARSKKATCMRMREFGSMVIEVPMLQAGCFATERILKKGSKKAAHPAQKPLAVVRPFIERLTDIGQVILDPFMGTATTGVACIQTGRNFVGIEIGREYFDIAQERIAEALEKAKEPQQMELEV